MIFVESPAFTADVKELLSDDEYASLQVYLVRQPDAGDLIVQTGGLRKIRWTSHGRGKRGVLALSITTWSRMRRYA